MTRFAVYEPCFDTPDRLIGIYEDLETAERVASEGWSWQCWYVMEVEIEEETSD